jgi:hypothetical protein
MATRVFFVTFGQKYRRERHPTFPEAHPDGWLTIEATDMYEARRAAYQMLGTGWSWLYDEQDLDWDPKYYPNGEIKRVKAADLLPIGGWRRP